MSKLDIKEFVEINTSAERAWEIIGPNFINIGEWGLFCLKWKWNYRH